MTASIDIDRLNRIGTLKHGEHNPNDDGDMCVMEAVAWVAHEPWSYEPKCVCPVISAFMVIWNDNLPYDETRTRLLKPLIPAIIGTKGSDELVHRRAMMAADWLVRAHTPAWLRAAKMAEQAAFLSAHPEITSFTQYEAMLPRIRAIRREAFDEWNAELIIVRDAGMAPAKKDIAAAVLATGRNAAWEAAKYASQTSWVWAFNAATDAAGAAAWKADRATIAKTVRELQKSAVDLIRRMAVIGDKRRGQ